MENGTREKLIDCSSVYIYIYIVSKPRYIEYTHNIYYKTIVLSCVIVAVL